MIQENTYNYFSLDSEFSIAISPRALLVDDVATCGTCSIMPFSLQC